MVPRCRVEAIGVRVLEAIGLVRYLWFRGRVVEVRTARLFSHGSGVTRGTPCREHKLVTEKSFVPLFTPEPYLSNLAVTLLERRNHKYRTKPNASTQPPTVSSLLNLETISTERRPMDFFETCQKKLTVTTKCSERRNHKYRTRSHECRTRK